MRIKQIAETALVAIRRIGPGRGRPLLGINQAFDVGRSGGRLDRVQHAMARDRVFEVGQRCVPRDSRAKRAYAAHVVPGLAAGTHRYCSGTGRSSSETAALAARTSISQIWPGAGAVRCRSPSGAVDLPEQVRAAETRRDRDGERRPASSSR